MKKSVITKVFLVILVSVMLIATVNHVQAVNDTNEYKDLLMEATGNNTSKNNTSNNVAKNNTSLNTEAISNKTNNTNTYNNSSLPKTGIEDSIPTMLLLVVFGISAVYAYKKIKDYNNI